jgi:uncharacterized protein (TIGR02266 family)
VRLAVRISTIDAEKDPETGDPFFLSADEECQNLSRGGVFVTTHEPVPAGSRLLVELTLPGGSPVQAIGRVAWTRMTPGDGSESTRAGIGIEFLGGSPDDFEAVERYVDGVARRSTRRVAAPAPLSPGPTA